MCMADMIAFLDLLDEMGLLDDIIDDLVARMELQQLLNLLR
jgi:hypothetical protein